MRYLLFGSVYVVVYLAVGALLAGHDFARTAVANALLLGLAASVCGVILYRRRSWDGSQRLFWDAFGVSGRQQITPDGGQDANRGSQGERSLNFGAVVIRLDALRPPPAG